MSPMMGSQTNVELCIACLLLLGGICLEAPGLAKGIHLAVLLKHGSILCGSLEVLADQGINALPYFLVVVIGPTRI